MTTPAVTVFPGSTVAEATWLASLSRLKRLSVTDHEGRLIGVVHRNALLNALIRDDGRIREEIRSRILAEDLPAARHTVEITVRNGVVDVSGRTVEAAVPRLLAEIKNIDDCDRSDRSPQCCHRVTQESRLRRQVRGPRHRSGPRRPARRVAYGTCPGHFQVLPGARPLARGH
ncbi:CBS domain-containing protein [Streptomyces sp. NPDC058316]|uniref:CBS domain-containing protein n=1 Tax=Streptomyces sp. NPDC058316 TaxID=3346442 RepID=UPI0036E86397